MDDKDPKDPIDPAADTAAFQAFAQDGQPANSSATRFRILTLIGGLVVFAGLVWLLLR